MPNFELQHMEQHGQHVYWVQGEFGAASWHFGEGPPEFAEAAMFTQFAMPQSLDDFPAEHYPLSPMRAYGGKTWMAMDAAFHAPAEPSDANEESCVFIGGKPCETRYWNFGGSFILHQWLLRDQDNEWLRKTLVEIYLDYADAHE